LAFIIWRKVRDNKEYYKAAGFAVRSPKKATGIIFGRVKQLRRKLLCSPENREGSLGKLEILPALRKLRKKNVRILVFTQSLADLNLIYGKDETRAMLDNFKHKIILGISEPESQEYFSKLAGERETIIVDEYKNEETRRERRIFPEEFGKLRDDLILFHPAGPPIRLRKNFYFKKFGLFRR
jgi:hypothetical protein